MSAEFPTSNEAVAKTAGQVRMFHRAPAFTQFCSSNGGWEASGGKPYLPAKKDPYEKRSGNPYHTWTAKVRPRRSRRSGPSWATCSRSRSTDATATASGAAGSRHGAARQPGRRVAALG